MKLPKPYLPAPDLADVLWCRFPHVESIRPGPYPRPCIVTWVSDLPDDPETTYRVRVVYGTSQFSGLPRGSEFDIDPTEHPASYQAAGLSKPTRFNLEKTVVVNYDEMFFALAPNGLLPAGPTPRLGTLHASRVNALIAANDFVKKKGARRR